MVTDGFRAKKSFVAKEMWFGYSFHAAFALLGVFLMLQAVA